MKSCEYFIIVALCLCHLCCIVVSQGKPKDEVSTILDKLFDKYDKRVRPNYGQKAVSLEISAYVLDLFNVDEQNHEFSVNMYLRHHWSDPRLTFDASPLPSGTDFVLVDADHAKKLWLPDTFIMNERKSIQHSIGSAQELTRITSKGDVLRSVRLTICASCRMQLGFYPFDRQLCVLEIESYGFNAKDVVFSWRHGKKNAVGISKQASSLKFSITGPNLKDEAVSLPTGNYSRLSIEFYLIRNSARDVQDRYFPGFLLTCISFLTLFTGTYLIRTQLSLILLVTMVIFMQMNGSSMPKVSHQTALDLYIFTCCLTIANVVLVNFLMQYFYKPVGRRPSPSVRMQRLEEDNHAGSYDDAKEIICADGGDVSGPEIHNRFEEILHKICSTSKYTIPLAFLVFNVIYWMVVLISSSGYPKDFLIEEDRD